MNHEKRFMIVTKREMWFSKFPNLKNSEKILKK